MAKYKWLVFLLTQLFLLQLYSWLCMALRQWLEREEREGITFQLKKFQTWIYDLSIFRLQDKLSDWQFCFMLRTIFQSFLCGVTQSGIFDLISSFSKILSLCKFSKKSRKKVCN
mmetsp:Transcript_2206/g.2901  ORF Transcript_2206/g.2901 Transcript_2206/m.2901 type:complete len:114 (+) Transcript_2206:344-685(+)